MATAGNPWGRFLGYLILGVTGSLVSGSGSQIINGEDCSPHSQPWQVALVMEDELFCSGVLVHPQWVLSAAHCFQNSYTIGLGLHSLEADREPGSQMVEASHSVQHPEYNRPLLANDLMLIKLDESVSESDTIRNISIASQCPTAGNSCLVSGWGLLANGRMPTVLQCVNVSVVSEELCSELYDPLYHPSMFCAGGGQDQKDSCNGDSGGPLICNGYLQGLVSFGKAPCGQVGVPGVYTNLCKFTEWIEKTVQAS
ncbi:kallikrein-4 isoform X1 [Nomascus leucogenys]|uniref:Kallikrein-4 n=2 Tax=Nomascus leucogenys TaxID=61853 RepID=G1R1C5_NOMLE|nr:kallikrein-4 isoform X1 [Nomascus leucogenys]SFW93217.1 TPA: kallikrein B1 [Nomascus leucogenys]